MKQFFARLSLFRLSLFAALALGAAELRAETVGEARAELVEKYLGKLAELAEWCEAQELEDEAEITREWLPPQRPLVLFVPLVRELDGRAQEPDEAIGDEKEWRERFGALRQAQAAALFALFQRAVEEKEYAIGFELLHETLREDPRHEAARLLLGYREYQGRWLTLYQLAKAQGNQVWHDEFGWIPKSQLERYEKGERYYKGRWLSAKEDAQLHAMLGGWEVATEHYRVRTDHSLEEGVRLAARLERLYDVWRQVFVRYYLSDAELGVLLTGGGPPRRGMPRHKVMYFRNRAEYNLALKRRQPNIEITTGYYEGKTSTAYFFAADEQDDSNLYHEATHQLFGETRAVSSTAGRDANFWIIEGIACYLESLVENENYCTIGGVDAIRLENARTRLLRDKFYVPLAELTAIGMNALQRDPRISPLYSQSSGLTYFLMYDHGGRYRDALVDYLVAIYTAHDLPETLAELTRTPYTELDRNYRRFIESIPVE